MDADLSLDNIGMEYNRFEQCIVKPILNQQAILV